MDTRPTFRETARSWLALPVGVVLALPVLLLVALWLYASALWHGLAALARSFRRTTPPDPHQPPHVFEARVRSPE